jgi:DNA replication and repair protein RecF
MQYLNNFKIQGSVENSILETLESSIKVDTIKKFTSKGPHRDSYEAFVSEGTERKIASGAFASQGQLRSLSLSVKLGATGFIDAVSGNSPVLLLDDVLSNGFGAQGKVPRFVAGKNQTF